MKKMWKQLTKTTQLAARGGSWRTWVLKGCVWGGGAGAEAKQKRKDDFEKKKTEKAATQMNSKEGNTVS